MADTPASMKQKYLQSEWLKEFTAFHARKGRIPTMAEMNSIPKLRQGIKEMTKDFTNGEVDPIKGYGYVEYPYASAAPSPGCTEKCPACKSHWIVGLPIETTGYSASYTDLDARDQLDNLRQEVQKDYIYICDLLEKYGDIIAKKWDKRTGKKRADLLKQALPGMYLNRGFPLCEFLKVRPGLMKETNEERQTRLRTAELVPYLNLEALSGSPLAIPALLYYRTTHDPIEWAAFDAHQHEYNFHSGMVQSAYNPHCMAMSRTRFGQLVPYQKQGLHGGTMISYPRAKLLFDAQKCLYGFCRSLVDLILGPGIKELGTTGKMELERLVDGRHSSHVVRKLDKLTHNSPFSSPPTFDIAAMVEQFRLRLQAAEDELEILQTDPAYLRAQLMRADGSAVLSGASSEKRYTELTELLVVSLHKHDHWKYLLSEAEATAKVLGSRTQKLRDDRQLPKDYDEALSMLEDVLRKHFHKQQDHLQTLLLASKHFNKYFIKREDGTFVVEEQLRKLSQDDPLLYNLVELTRWKQGAMGFHASTMFLYIDEILSHTTKEDRERMDRGTYMVISDMAIIDKALTAIKFHRPRCSGFDIMLKGMSEEEALLQAAFSFTGTSQSLLGDFLVRTARDHMSELCYTNAYKAGYKELRPSLAVFLDTPAPTGRPNRVSLDALAQSHESSKAFWSEVRRWRKKSMVESEMPLEEAETRVQCLSFSGSVKHAKLIEEEQQLLLAVIEDREQLASARQGEAAKKSTQSGVPQTIWGTAEAKDGQVAAPKTKEKTRPARQIDIEARHGDDTPVDDLMAATEGLTLPPKIEVKQNSIRLLTRMYAGIDDAKANKGTVTWDDLVAALSDAGFQATANGGSAVTFRNIDGKGSIVFHRPHPDPNVDSIMLRSMGKRLSKWFGWEKESFIERAKA